MSAQISAKTGSKKEENLSAQKVKEALLVETYKLTFMRAQLEAITEILIKRGLTTYEEIWKKTNEKLKNSKV